MDIDVNTTPEMVLQSLARTSFIPSANNSEDRNELQIFLSYLRFIMKGQPEGIVNGIWEDILWNCLKYSQHVNSEGFRLQHLDSEDMHFFANNQNHNHTDFHDVATWLIGALRTRNKCRNPYLRLELFRLLRLFRSGDLMDSNYVLVIDSFVHTISEIQPHRLYPSGGARDILFSIYDFSALLSVWKYGIQMDISKVISDQLNENSLTRFLLHCIQLIGIFSTKAGTESDPKIKLEKVKYCMLAFMEDIGNLVSDNGKTPWQLFKKITAPSLLRVYIVEALRDVTTVVINYEPGDVREILMALRDIIVEDLGVGTKTTMLPKQLLSCEIHGHTSIRAHAMLLLGLSQGYDTQSYELSDDEDDFDISVYSNWEIAYIHLENAYRELYYTD